MTSTRSAYYSTTELALVLEDEDETCKFSIGYIVTDTTALEQYPAGAVFRQ